MVSVLARLTRAVLSVFMIFTNLLSFATQNSAKPIADQNEGCQLRFATISDTHIEDMGLFEWLLGCGLLDMSKAQAPLDALIFDGDMTNLGSEVQYERLTKTLASYPAAKQVLIAMGNHDSWCGSWDGDVRTPEESIGRFCDYTQKISGIKTEHPYYATDINGYPVIVLGSERNNTGASMTEEQLNWFADEMQKASLTGKPIFVFFHQSINGTHGLPYNWEMEEDADITTGGIGEASDRVLEIIKSYKNVFYFSGHIHAGFSKPEDNNCYVSVEEYDGYTLINIPSYSNGDFSHGGCWQLGTGYVVEVYENELCLRARNYITGTWLSKYDVTVPLIP